VTRHPQDMRSARHSRPKAKNEMATAVLDARLEEAAAVVAGAEPAERSNNGRTSAQFAQANKYASRAGNGVAWSFSSMGRA
jgi:hypothetical protein